MDISTVPRNMDIDRWYSTIKNFNIIFWDSTMNKVEGVSYKILEPKVYPKKNKVLYKIVDKKGRV